MDYGYFAQATDGNSMANPFQMNMGLTAAQNNSNAYGNPQSAAAHIYPQYANPYLAATGNRSLSSSSQCNSSVPVPVPSTTAASVASSYRQATQESLQAFFNSGLPYTLYQKSSLQHEAMTRAAAATTTLLPTISSNF
ncbi:hypothetical protein WR25_03435 [Diploscapter pachys]|uniref:Uncharacterized protein n=1 Tax=Diploscapter pachys TaxID=2018661 RepID=A0A2A2J756_9BILA|nr:hypothetical protein WR25_03435 [Diploscapter pachys]